MPDIDLIPIPSYQPLQPYYWTYDNMPLEAINQREQIINNAVDANTEILRASIGSTGSLNVRLDQSLLPNGDLRAAKIDEALHNIGSHEDGSYDGVDYVRMTLSEREKLALIANEAKNVTLQVDLISEVVFFDNGPIIFENSSTISFTVNQPNRISADVTVGLQNAHRHFYQITPLSKNLTNDYINFITGLNVPYTQGSLRVYVNGTRLFSDISIYYAPPVPTRIWLENKFTETVDGIGFYFDNQIKADDVIRIDFDLPLD